MTILPPWPDAATLAVLPYWAAGGAACGFGAVFFNWLVKPGVFGEIVEEKPIHVPGAPKAGAPVEKPWSMAGLRAALIGATLATLWAWGWYGPEGIQRRLGLFFAVLGVVHSVWQLMRVHRDAPAVGEPPPDDPDKTVQARLPGAWWGIVMAGLGVVMAYF